MADATDLKSVGSNPVRVRIPPSAPIFSISYGQSSSAPEFSLRSLVRCAPSFWVKSSRKIASLLVQDGPIVNLKMLEIDFRSWRSQLSESFVTDEIGPVLRVADNREPRVSNLT